LNTANIQPWAVLHCGRVQFDSTWVAELLQPIDQDARLHASPVAHTIVTQGEADGALSH